MLANARFKVRKSSKTKFVIAGILLAGAVLTPFASILLVFLAKESYCSVCRVEVNPTSESMFTPQFVEAAFGTDRSFRLRPGRGTALVSIEAFADSPQEAADRANGAVAKIQVALSRQQPAAVSVVEAAEPGLRPVSPNKQLRSVVGIGIGAVVGLAGSVMLIVAVKSQKREGT